MQKYLHDHFLSEDRRFFLNRFSDHFLSEDCRFFLNRFSVSCDSFCTSFLVTPCLVVAVQPCMG